MPVIRVKAGMRTLVTRSQQEFTNSTSLNFATFFCSHATTRQLLDEFSLSVIFGSFAETYWHLQILVKIEQK
jgi:hypothetical protein